MKKKLLFAINVDWYFNLHWKERILSEMTSDYDVTLCYTITDESFSVATLPLLPLPIQRSSINPFSNFLSFYMARKVLRHHDFDLVQTVTIKPNLYFGLWARLYKTPIVFTIPGQGTTISSPGIKFKLLRHFIYFLYRFAGKNDKSYFVFENKHDRTHFLQNNICAVENSTVVSGAGIDLKKFPYTKEICSDAEPVKVLFAARLLKGKGLEDLIKAAKIINATKQRLTLYVAGIADTDARDRIPLAQIESWHTDGAIKYLGQVDNMPKLLSACHIVSLPTKYGEGLPRILLEANACGRPVITTDIPGCNDFVENGVNGFLVHPGNTAELVEAIMKLFDPAKRKTMGQAGRQKVEKHYSKEHVIQQYRAVYQKTAASTYK